MRDASVFQGGTSLSMPIPPKMEHSCSAVQGSWPASWTTSAGRNLDRMDWRWKMKPGVTYQGRLMAITSIRMEHHQSGETPLESTHETLGEDAIVQLIEPKNTCRIWSLHIDRTEGDVLLKNPLRVRYPFFEFPHVSTCIEYLPGFEREFAKHVWDNVGFSNTTVWNAVSSFCW